MLEKLEELDKEKSAIYKRIKPYSEDEIINYKAKIKILEDDICNKDSYIKQLRDQVLLLLLLCIN